MTPKLTFLTKNFFSISKKLKNILKIKQNWPFLPKIRMLAKNPNARQKNLILSIKIIDIRISSGRFEYFVKKICSITLINVIKSVKTTDIFKAFIFLKVPI